MNLKDKIKSLLKQGSLYRSQGLLIEAISRYDEAIELIQANDKIKNKATLIEGIQKKRQEAGGALDKFEAAPETPEIDAKIQDLIKQQFAFSEDKDKGALEGAIALAKFGQFQRALEEFQKLLAIESIRVDAAKNIIRCYMALETLPDAVSEFKKWETQGDFPPIHLNKIKVFFEATLERAGMGDALAEAASTAAADDPPEARLEMDEPTIEMIELDEAKPVVEVVEVPEIQAPEIEVPEPDDDEILDINSIGFTPDKGPLKDKMLELNVSFQSGDIISLLIPGRDRDIIDYMVRDLSIENAQFYSPMAIFSGTGKVIGKTKIESGPRRGDYSVDVKVIAG